MLRSTLCRALSLRRFPRLPPCALVSTRANDLHVSQLIHFCKHKDHQALRKLESEFATKVLGLRSCAVCLLSLSRANHEGPLSEKLEQEIEESMCTGVSGLSLMEVVALCFDYKATSDEFTENLLKVINTRREDVECDATLVKLFENINPKVNPELYQHLEAVAMEQSSEISGAYAHRIVCALGRSQQRNEPLLIVLADILTENLSQLRATRDLSYIALSYAKLGVCCNNLMSAICHELVLRGAKMPCRSLLSCFYSFSGLRWFHKEAIDMLSDQIVKYPLEPGAWKSLIISCGRLAYMPPSFKEHLSTALPKFSGSFLPKHRLDVAFNLAVNDALLEDEAREITSSDFMENLFGTGSDLNLTVIKLKLQSIAAASGFSASTAELSSEEIKEKIPFLNNQIVNTMRTMATQGKHFNASVPSNVGSIIAVEMVIDEEGSIQPISHLNQLKPGWKKVAVQTLTSSDVLQPSLNPVGFHQLSYHLLAQKGYTVLPIYAGEFYECSTVVSRVKFMEKKLKELS